ALADMGLIADYVPPVYNAAHLGEGLPAEGKVLILLAEIGSPALTAALESRSIPYDDIPVYRTVYDNPRSEQLRYALDAGAVHFVTFSSASTVKGLLATVDADVDNYRVTALYIEEQAANEARKHNMTIKIAAQATNDALVEVAQDAASSLEYTF